MSFQRRPLHLRRLLYLGAIPMAALPLSRNARPVVVVGDSMSPAYHNRQIVWMRRWHPGMSLRVGDVVVFRHDGGVAIKRVLALSGERLPRYRFRGGSYMFSDEVPPRMYACFRKMRARGMVVRDDVTVPDGCVYAIGDNRNASYDSRDFGPIAVEEVMGVIPSTEARPYRHLIARAR